MFNIDLRHRVIDIHCWNCQLGLFGQLVQSTKDNKIIVGELQ